MAGRHTDVEPERVVVRDRRRLDPVTGLPRQVTEVPPSPEEQEPAAQEQDAAVEDVAPPDPVAVLTDDLQRLSAEFANYRKRVQRDQVAVAERATASLVERLLPLLDDVDRARAHGDLDGAFKVVGEGLEALVTKLGVERFGAPGDAFDPKVHEAVMSAAEDSASAVSTCAQVFSQGYRFASGRILRPARVSVAEPARSGAAQAPEA